MNIFFYFKNVKIKTYFIYVPATHTVKVFKINKVVKHPQTA